MSSELPKYVAMVLVKKSGLKAIKPKRNRQIKLKVKMASQLLQ